MNKLASIASAAVLALVACASTPPPRPPTYLPAECNVPDAGPSTPLVYLRVASDKHAILERGAGAGKWCPLCVAPCNGYVPLSGAYRIVLDDRTGAEFSMPNMTNITLKVDEAASVVAAPPPSRLVVSPMPVR